MTPNAQLGRVARNTSASQSNALLAPLTWCVIGGFFPKTDMLSLVCMVKSLISPSFALKTTVYRIDPFAEFRSLTRCPPTCTFFPHPTSIVKEVRLWLTQP